LVNSRIRDHGDNQVEICKISNQKASLVIHKVAKNLYVNLSTHQMGVPKLNVNFSILKAPIGLVISRNKTINFRNNSNNKTSLLQHNNSNKCLIRCREASNNNFHKKLNHAEMEQPANILTVLSFTLIKCNNSNLQCNNNNNKINMEVAQNLSNKTFNNNSFIQQVVLWTNIVK